MVQADVENASWICFCCRSDTTWGSWLIWRLLKLGIGFCCEFPNVGNWEEAVGGIGIPAKIAGSGIGIFAGGRGACIALMLNKGGWKHKIFN